MKKESAPKVGLLARVGTIATVISSIVSLLFVLFFAALIIPGLLSKASEGGANVAVINIDGVIQSAEGSAFSSAGAPSGDIVKLIEEAADDEDIQAIVFRINSPGGTPVATEEIANAIKKANKTTVAVIREAGASGAYWVASATDHIFASRLSITGSIGVVASYVEFSGFLKDHNITYQRLVAGDYKDAGSPFKTLEPDERALFERLLDRTHDEFIDAVATNRKLPRADVEALANGFVYLGIEAQQLGLVDEIGGMDEAYKYIENLKGITVSPAEFSRPPTFFEALSGAFAGQSFQVGRGIGSALLEQRVQNTPSVFT